MKRLLAILLLLAAPGVAAARSESRTLGYPRAQVWSTAVRFVAVDERAKIVDKDADAGYVLFELVDDGKRYRGSLEIVSVPGDAAGIRFVITLAERPSWMELAMLKRLEQKVRADLGAPLPPPRKPAEPAQPPAGDDKPAPGKPG